MTESDSESELIFVPLGGSGEIGMNLNLYGFRGQWILVDCGITFADAALPGIDILMPDPTFIAERKDDLIAIVLTHAHEDHLGAVAHLWPRLECPVYATPFTAAILRRKLEEAGLLDRVPVNEVTYGEALALGPFTVTYLGITHSVPEGSSLAIRTDAGTILHTGDWKLDPEPLVGTATDEAAFRTLGDDGVLAMVCDSTNVFSPGSSGSEAAVRNSLMELVDGRTGRVAITTFASNVARVATAAAVAQAHERELVVIGRSLLR
ncbi:MAG TPA: ribonuclease J, partial [Alphaproteobacteria bacterium]|nr:ribonuclease J [Alphaproteobacteria bacterium]